jgi:putative transcriptional regulator
MIKSRLRVLIAQEEALSGSKLTYGTLAEQTGLSKDTINRLANNDTKRIDFSTLNALCVRFGCQPGDVLIYIADNESQTRFVDFRPGDPQHAT